MLPWWLPVPGHVVDEAFEKHVRPRLGQLQNHAAQYSSCLPEIEIRSSKKSDYGHAKKTFDKAHHSHAHYVCCLVEDIWSAVKEGDVYLKDTVQDVLSLAGSYNDRDGKRVEHFLMN